MVFWKQNDTGLYGRRQEMLVKYLARSERVRRIVHFDAPMNADAFVSLPDLGDRRGLNQSNRVFLQTAARLLPPKRSGKIRQYTFLHNRPDDADRSYLSRLFPRSDEYMRFIGKVLRDNGIGERRTVFLLYPVNFRIRNIVRAHGPDLVVTDVVDDQRRWLEAGSEREARLTDNYREALESSDVVITNCRPLQETMRDYAEDVHLVPNACEPPEEYPRPRGAPGELRGISGPIIGYVGNLSPRIDVDLLEYVARTRPDWNLVFVGYTPSSREVLRLDAYDNVRFVGLKGYPEVRRYIACFDAAIIPHVNDELTRYMNPLKAFVYCSLGVPVVSTAIEGIEELADWLHVAKDREEFVYLLDLALAEGNRDRLDPGQIRLLREHSWQRRAEEMIRLMDREWDRGSG